MALFSFLLLAALAAPKAGPAPAATLNWSRLDAVINHAIAAGQLPGAVLEIGHGGKTVYKKAYGDREVEPAHEKMTTDTIFDCASLTKVIATAPAVMQLLEQGKIRLNDPVAKYLPGFGAHGKDQITIRELLTHYSGLPPDLPQRPVWEGYATGVEKAYATTPTYPPGSHFEYSDINYVVLAELVHKLTGEMIDQWALHHLWQPLGMDHTRFLPPAAWRGQIAPTEKDELGHWERGVVNDPTAHAMGGVTGDAGMFSNADDLAKFAQMLLDGGLGKNGARVLAPVSVAKMTTPQTPFNVPDVRGLGWDIDTPFSSNRGDFLPVGSYGHTGFTGTSMWMDPASGTYIILLSNAIHPKGRPPLLSLRSEVSTAVAAILSLDDVASWGRIEDGLERSTGYNDTNSAAHRTIYRNGSVLTGIDVLELRNFTALKGKRVGLITNPTGLDRNGQRNLDAMLAAGVNVTAGFSPEHGWLGDLDTAIGNSKDAKTGIPVFSAYGEGNAARSLPEAGLKLVDLLVYDIQDVGVRYYTYETTLAYTLQTAAAHHIPVMVLDRPDPIDGIHVQGPVLEAKEKSFIGYFPGMPVRNGMTVGELAEMFNQAGHLGAELEVVKMQGWSRGDFYDETGLPWVNPSPNMRSLNEATLYPGVGLIEATNVSVGRGTDSPFEQFGAPWIDERALAEYLNARRLPGVRFVPVSFTPTSDRYAKQLCHGVNVIVTDRELLDAPEMGVEIASALAQLNPHEWDSAPMHGQIGSAELIDLIRRGDDPRRLAADWQDAVEEFERVREPYLLYH